MIYLDYCANTPVSKKVLDAFCEVESNFIGNANSNHSMGRLAKEKMDSVIENIADLIGCKKEEIIFTSGATEANNLAILGIAQANRSTGKHIISTSLEHTSVSATLSALQMQGYEIDLCQIDNNGLIDLEMFEDLLRDDTVLVSISAVDSEVGIIQPIREIKEILKDYPNCHLHIDATQAIGKIPFDFSIGDTISFAPHKFYGLNGCGVLVKKENVKLSPQIHGGLSTTVYRSGTPNLALAVSIEVALSEALNTMDKNYEYVESINKNLREELTKINVQINSPNTAIPHILNIGVNGIKGVEMQKMLDEKGICVSVKSACSSDLLPSKAVMALTRNKKKSFESFRISLSYLTTQQHIEQLVQAIREIMEVS